MIDYLLTAAKSVRRHGFFDGIIAVRRATVLKDEPALKDRSDN